MDNKTELERIQKIIEETQAEQAKRSEQTLDLVARFKQARKWIDEGLFN